MCFWASELSGIPHLFIWQRTDPEHRAPHCSHRVQAHAASALGPVGRFGVGWQNHPRQAVTTLHAGAEADAKRYQGAALFVCHLNHAHCCLRISFCLPAVDCRSFHGGSRRASWCGRVRLRPGFSRLPFGVRSSPTATSLGAPRRAGRARGDRRADCAQGISGGIQLRL